jgi:hypothetical protein
VAYTLSKQEYANSKSNRILERTGQGQCAGLTKNGDPCRSFALSGSDLCYFHGGGADPVEVGKKGGRPKKPTVAEARALTLESLVPRALVVLQESLEGTDRKIRFQAARDVLDRSWGRPAQTSRVSTEVPPDKPWEDLTREEEKALMAALDRRIALGDNGSSHE